MKKFLILFLLVGCSLFAQQTYYDDVDLSLSGIALKNELATKIISTHTENLSYNDAREALKIVDLEPNQTTNVALIYGFSSGVCPSSSGSDNDHRLRNKNDFGGGSSCKWNREHTYPKSKGTPNLGTSGPGADAHMLRASDVQRNGSRGSIPFGAGSGNSGTQGGFWYPGDEWKGDVARMMMYMYLRYGTQCLPNNVGDGNAVANDANMIDLFLDWNAQDPVSTMEENRNDYLELTSNEYGQGNRNPFIDNPFLATRIWGGQDAEDIWGYYLDTPSFSLEENITIYPNPVKDVLSITAINVEVESVRIYSILGKEVKLVKNTTTINLAKLTAGIYFIEIKTNEGSITKKIVKK